MTEKYVEIVLKVYYILQELRYQHSSEGEQKQRMLGLDKIRLRKNFPIRQIHFAIDHR